MDDNRYYKKKIIEKSIYSTYLEETRKAIIYLPPEYDDKLSYPIIYCQDGEQFFNLGKIATQANKLILEEDIEPMIIVGIEMRKETRRSEYHPDGSRFSMYELFVVEELIPTIERNFSVKENGMNRFLAGDSLGGAISIHLALDFKHLFHNVISFSGAFFESTHRRLLMEGDLSWLQIYMTIGLQEDEVKTKLATFDFLHFNRKTMEILKSKKVKLYYVEKQGSHTWGFWQKEIPNALRYFFK